MLRAVTHHHLRSLSYPLSSKSSEPPREWTRLRVSCCPLLGGLGSAAICWGSGGRGGEEGASWESKPLWAVL